LDFTLSDEQVALRNSVDRFVADAHGFEQARARAAGPVGFSRADWASFAELGWLMLLIPEELGGLGLALPDAALLMEGFGRGLVAAPFVSTAVIGVRLLAASDVPSAQAGLLEKIAGGEALVALATEEAGSRFDPLVVATTATAVGDGYMLNGAKLIVPDGSNADVFLVSARLSGRIALFEVDAGAAGLVARPYRTIDNRRACDLDFAATPATLLIADAAEPLERAMDDALLMLAAEAIGCMDAAIAMTVDYLKTREQFGRTLSKFQVLTHRIADMFVRLENARSMLFRGLSVTDAPRDVRAAGVSATMVTIFEAAEFVCGQAIQLHGGIGMAEEHAVGHYYKRIRAIARTWGDLEYHRRRHLHLTQRRAA
jgi:alkylation response protein AidB-like acyl-CoA dehydrogenase